MKRAVFLTTVALLAMLILAPLAWAQGGTMLDGTTFSNPCARLAYKERHKLHLSREEKNMRAVGFCNQGPDVVGVPTDSASASTFSVPPGTGGAAILLPAASLLLGSGILTYAILRRR